MKTATIRRLRQVPRRGVALIIVLACIVLLTIMVVAFLVGIRSEVQSSKYYANGSSVKLLAQSATDLVMAEIRDATADGTLCWASQPGMIRTYDSNGAVKNYYKLYSDDAMVTSTFDHTQTLVPDGTATVNGSTVAWYNQKGVYVDLNQPVTVDGVNQYPIVDGNSSDYSSVTFSTSNTTTPLPTNILPAASNTVNVLGASTLATGLPMGFWLNSKTPAQSGSGNVAPMPVKWLYVLQDGTIANPDSATTATSTVTFTNSVSKPSSTNPIVGRIAFWTDDETCKVNINTAAEGSYWDIPHANVWNGSASQEETIAEDSPTQYEFQRYPGHPATTSLSAIFNLPSAEALYSIIPRLGPGGSVGGTVQTTQGKAYTAVSPNGNRLYATTDDLLFQPTRALNSAISNAPSLNQSLLKQDRFFLTTSSRAPDVNLFNQPRVCIWPESISNNSIYRSVYDQLIAFCTTMRNDLASPYIYYFQRQDPTDPNIDLPATNDNNGIDRNRALLEYLRNLTTENIPGFGANFAAKYNTTNLSNKGTDRDQILTEIFDYIRSTNLSEPGVTPYTAKFSTSYSGGIGQVIPIDDTTNNTHGFGRFRSIQGASLLFIANADGDVSASQPATNQVAAGFRRIQPALLVQLFDPSVGAVWDYVNLNMSITGGDQLKVGTQSLFNSPISFHQAYFYLSNAFWGDQLGFTQLMIGNGSQVNSLIGSSFDVPNTGGANGTGGSFTFAGGTITLQLLTPTGATNPNLPVQTVQLTFPAATLPLPSLAWSNVYDYNYVPTVIGGPYNFRYFSTPPTLSTPNTVSGPDATGNNSPSKGGRSSMLGQAGTDSESWFTPFDTVRSVAIASDPRLAAAQKNPSTSLFSPVGKYTSGTTLITGMHSQFSGIGQPYYGALQGKLVQNANYDNLGSTAGTSYTQNGVVYNSTGAYAGSPGGFGGPQTCYNDSDVFDPSTGTPVNGVALGKTSTFAIGNILGDWDSGVGCVRDGPFINKSDEGDAGSGSNHPYIWKEATGNVSLNTTLYSPNRQIPSAGNFGSLPTGVFANRPWQTLLFRPGPIGHTGLGTSVNLPVATATAGGDQGPPYTNSPANSFAGPPDHLLLDLFTMPVVEPYAISEPLSTAGRINMNSLIVPFNYINRDTGLRAVLKNERVISIADSQAYGYKTMFAATGQTNIRYPVNLDATLSQFYSRRFNNKDIFRSASEICDIDIVPTDNSPSTDPNPVPAGTTNYPVTRANMDKYWNTATTGHRLTGDNARERIYATLYPRLTTKSNTFTIHFRVQTLKPINTPGADLTKWHEGSDVVTGEYRGSQTVERYVDPNDATIPDFANPANYSQTLAPYYRFRVVATKQFAP